jgi:Ca2+/Na+ antiporter
MFMLAIAIDYSAGLPLIVAAGIAMYIASKALSDALVGGRTGLPGRLAIGQWLPIAVVAVAAAITNRQSMAVGLIFSTAVACLSLATGAVGFLGGSTCSTAARRSWAMLVPVGLLVFLAGFRASVSLFNASVLALQGLCVLLLWTDGSPADEPQAVRPPLSGRGFFIRFLQALLGLMLAMVGAWFGMRGIDLVAASSESASAGLLTATLLSPLLVLPIIGTGTELAQQNESVTAVSSHVGVALLNACLLLPMVVLVNIARQMIQIKSMTLENIHALPFPLAVWRVDVVMLIALGLFLLPVALGKWSISKLQGLGLMLGYLIYLGLAIIIGVLRV